MEVKAPRTFLYVELKTVVNHCSPVFSTKTTPDPEALIIQLEPLNPKSLVLE
jgi:hypothetical protein